MTDTSTPTPMSPAPMTSAPSAFIARYEAVLAGLRAMNAAEFGATEPPKEPLLVLVKVVDGV